jgi:hypothetical protein
MADDLVLPIQSSPMRQRVYIKSYWPDDWVHVPGLWCSDLAWGTLPQIGAARIEWKAFTGVLPHEPVEIYHGWQFLDRKIVKVEIENVDDDAPQTVNTLRWIGVIDRDSQKRDDVIRIEGLKQITGDQVFSAAGIEQVFVDTIVRYGWFASGENTKGRIGVAPAFNEGGRPNRSAEKIGGSYVFSKYSQGAKFWSTLNAVEYLLKTQQPKTGVGLNLCEIDLLGDGSLFDWDRPEVPQHGRSVSDIVSEFIHARRGLGAHFIAADDPDNHWQLSVFTHAQADVVLSSENPNQKLFSNPFRYNLAIDRAAGLARDARPDILTMVSRGLESQYDQVIAQGAPRTACFSVNKTLDNTLEDDWTDADKTGHDAAGSGEGGYPSSATERKERNEGVRSTKYGHVYARFKLPDAFDGKAKGGNGGDPKDVFDTSGQTPQDASEPSNWPLGWRFQRRLSLYEGQDYSGSQLPKWPYQTATLAEPDRLGWMVFLPLGSSKFKRGDVHGLSSSSDKKFSLSLKVQEFPPRFRMETHNAPQHAIGKNQWTPLSAGHGDTASEAKYDWREFIVTLTLEETRRAESIYPAPLVNNGQGIAILRTKYLDCGDEFRLDWLTGNTVVGVNASEELQRANATGGYVRDDRPFLDQIARAAYEFYRRPRVSCVLQKPGATQDLWLGHLIEQLGRSTDPGQAVISINTVVTQVTLRFGESTSGAPGPPMQSWTTSHAELDGMAFLR